MPIKPRPGDIVVKPTEWGEKAYVGIGRGVLADKVTLTLCGPRWGYARRSYMTPDKARELAHALLHKANELCSSLDSAASQEIETKKEETFEGSIPEITE